MQAVLSHVQVRWRSSESEQEVGAERTRGNGVGKAETSAHVMTSEKKGQNSRPVALETMRQPHTPEVVA